MNILTASTTFFFSLLIIHSSYSQNIKTAKDSTLLIECSQMPAAAPEYTLSFIGSNLDLEAEHVSQNPIKKASEEDLKKALSEDPENVDLALKLARFYRRKRLEAPYNEIMESTYGRVYTLYQQRPDSFEVVEQMVSLLQEGQNYEGILTLWNQYTMDHPKDVKGLTQFSIQLSIQGYLDKAKHFVEQAYQIDPQEHDVYLAAMMSEFTNVLIQLQNIMKIKGDEDDKLEAMTKIDIDPAFFDKAIEAGAPAAANMGKDAAEMLVIFYRTILQFVNMNIGKEVINIKPLKADAALIKEIEKRAKAQIKSKINNKYFSYKVLTTLEILKGNEDKAVKYWKESGDFLAADTDILRLLSFAHFLKLDFDNAILYLEKKLSFAQDYNDSYALGRFYVYNKQLDKAFDIFDQTQSLNLGDFRATCAKVSILIQQNKFEEAQQLMATLPAAVSNDVMNSDANYFMALCTLATGDMNEAFKRLKSIHAESDYKTDADKLLNHFFKAEVKD